MIFDISPPTRALFVLTAAMSSRPGLLLVAAIKTKSARWVSRNRTFADYSGDAWWSGPDRSARFHQILDARSKKLPTSGMHVQGKNPARLCSTCGQTRLFGVLLSFVLVVTKATEAGESFARSGTVNKHAFSSESTQD